MRKILLLLLTAVTASVAAFGQVGCEKLAELRIPNTTITTAQTVKAGTFVAAPAPFSGMDLSAFYKALPEFCRVVAEAKPTSDSDIGMEIWLPSSGWNGKLQGIGQGGFAGLIDTRQLGVALKAGYVATATDSGHRGSPGEAAWALGHPEKVIDYGHRGIHEMTRVAKAVTQAYYAKAPERSYFAGCSDGGREALMEAQRYPEDYDGILAGAPTNDWTRLLTLMAANTQALTKDAASFVPAAKIPALAAAVNAACDASDGVKDGILNDPRRCKFDPATMECTAGESDKCLTGSQVATLKALYHGLQDSNGNQIFPGYLPGAEGGQGGWGLWITGPAPAKSLLAAAAKEYFSNFVYAKPDWDFKSFNAGAALKAAEETTAAALNATDPDLKNFKARGGKLILYHGWDDPAIPALNTVNYYESVIAKMGQRNVDAFVRLYMAPGVQHCGDGPGPNTFGQAYALSYTDPTHSIEAALEQWVEKGTAPAAIIASRYKGDGQDQPHAVMTRPLCAYPQTAKYKGTGDTNDAANFNCQ